MKVKRFNSYKHYEIMLEWLTQREEYHPSEEEMPQFGYVCYVNDKPAAMAFLRLVEGGFAQLDGLVTNPWCSSKERHLAIEAVVTKCMTKGRDLKLKSITSFSKDENIIVRSRSHGFIQVPHTVLVSSLVDDLKLN